MQETKQKKASAWLTLLLSFAVAGVFAWYAQEKQTVPAAPTLLTEAALPTTSKPETTALAAPTTEETEPTTAETEPTSEEATQARLPFDTDDPLLILVNRDNPLPADYAPELTQISETNRRVATAAYDDLCAMLAAGRQEGLYFLICSAYRSTEVQQQLFDEDVRTRVAAGMSYEEAYADTALYTMVPGCSEHESGLALDIVAVHNQNLDASQEYTAETQWLHEHCWEYGFILRYPNGKSDITGIAYESWHYRYVGKEAARYLTENSLTLEELHELLKAQEEAA